MRYSYNPKKSIDTIKRAGPEILDTISILNHLEKRFNCLPTIVKIESFNGRQFLPANVGV